MEIIETKKAPAAIGPYSQAVLCNHILFTAGQIPVDPATGIVPDGIAAQSVQVMENIKGILEEAGLTFQNIIKTTVFIQNMDDFAKINEIYSNYFSAPYPARSCVEVARLPKNVLIEIECIAALL